MDYEKTAEDIELDIKAAEEIVEVGRALERLSQNSDWKKVIDEGYLKDEAVRLVHLKGSPQMKAEEHQKSIVRCIDAIGEFYGYLSKVGMQADMAEDAIAQSREALVELEEEQS